MPTKPHLVTYRRVWRVADNRSEFFKDYDTDDDAANSVLTRLRDGARKVEVWTQDTEISDAH
jgi:hypothetical protein